MLAGAELTRGQEALHLWSTLYNALQRTLEGLLWQLPLTKELERFYTTLQLHHLRAATALLLTWEPPG
jgi:hypothetical protein